MQNESAVQLLDITTVRELVSFISQVQADGNRLAWKPVDDNDNNLATINLGSDPAAGVIERITNALDAILEQEWVSRGEPTNLSTPRSAVEAWFKIKDGRLATLATDEVRKLDDVATKVQVTLRDSDRPDKPTVDVRDYGIGIGPEDFSTSILSLNRDRKLRKLFLAGAFGQGGSTALAFSRFTLICSRKSSTNGTSNPFSFSVVRFNPGDPNVDKHGVYEYLVDHATGQPFVADLSEEEFPAGTLVRHLTMEVGKYSAVMTAPTGSLWFLTHNYLFDPVLPFRISDAREGKKSTNRTVTGNHRLLTQGAFTQYQRSATLTFGDGTVSLKWWVLSAEGDNARGRLTQYVMVSKPIIVTYNGQKQGDFPNTLIKDALRLPYLDRYLIVHVDCDKLDAESRRQLFPTTREALRDTPIGDELRRLVVETLAGDEELKRLDQERKQRYLKQEDQAAVDNIRKRLARRVKVFTSAGGSGKGPSIPPPEPGPTPEPKQPIPVQDPPTFIRITNQDPRKVYAGRSFTLRFETDARPDYFIHADNFIAVISPPSFGQYTGTTNVRDGYGVAYFKASDDLEVGASATIILEVRPPHAQSLSASIDVEVAEIPESGTGPGEARTPNINPHWVLEADAFWSDNGWDRTSVAKVTQEEDAIDIYVSADNERLNRLIARAQRHETAAVESVKNFYLEHISFFALLEDIDRANNRTIQSEEDNEGNDDISLKHGCETICGILETLFDVVITAS